MHTDREWSPERAGQVLRTLTIRRGLDVADFDRLPKGPGQSTVRRIINGQFEKVGLASFGKMESSLNLPVGSVAAIIDGDRTAIAEMKWRDDDFYLREFILSELPADDPPAKPRRRRTG